MSYGTSPKSPARRIPGAVILPITALIVVGSFVIYHRAQQQAKRAASSPTDAVVAEAPKTAPAKKSEAQAKPVAAGTPVESAPVVAAAPAAAPAAPPAPPSCWEARFDLQGARLTAVQKESLGERTQKLKLAELFSKFSARPEKASICVRSGGHAIAFDRDSKDRTVLLVHAGSGRIGPKSSLDVQVCTDPAKCAPCKIKKDSFEEAMLGGGDADAQYNDSEDVTAQLSPEVRRELARLESQAKPAPVDAWQLQSASPHCGRS